MVRVHSPGSYFYRHIVSDGFTVTPIAPPSLRVQSCLFFNLGSVKKRTQVGMLSGGGCVAHLQSD